MSATDPRPRRHRRAPAGTAGAEALLGALAELPPFTLLAVRPVRGTTEVAVHDLGSDPRCGAASLFGLRAPSGSRAVGAAFLGRPRPGGPTPEGTGAAGEVRVDVAVERSGRVLSVLRDPAAADGGSVEGPVDGRVVDALHRVLHIPSPGPPPPMEELVVGLWMDQVVPLLDGGDCPSWAAVARCHPAAGPDPGPGSLPPSPEALAGMGASLADDDSWDRLRRSAAAGRFRAPELEPDEAAWMDATLFARWMVESFPPALQVASVIRGRGGVGAADGIESVLRLLPPAARVA